MPAAGVAAPACWMNSAGFLIATGTLLAHGAGRSALPLNGRHDLDAGVATLVTLPGDECGDPLSGLDFGG
jgi:hypothetical protein